MRRVGAAFLGLVLLATPLRAETVLVRSGEHPAFSRLVLKPEKKASWAMGRTETGYLLRFEADDLSFDTTRVFDLIPRNRITAVEGQDALHELQISVSEGAHATAFETPAGALVIDVADGPAPSGSRFEAALPAASERATEGGAAEDGPTVVQGIAEPEIVPDAPQTASEMPALGGVAILPAAKPTVSYRPAPTPDPRLNVYWAAPLAIEEPDSGAAEANMNAGMTEIGMPAIPDPRISEAEARLLEQLGRAASQGLIEPAPAVRRAPAAPQPASEETAVMAPGPAASPHGQGASGAEDAAPMHSETSIDRESPSQQNRDPVTASGGACFPEGALNVGMWGDERGFNEQIAEAQLMLLGEFDVASPEAVAKLAKLYLFFGFGAEARSALTAFGVSPRNAETLMDIGLILDGLPVGTGSALPSMLDCNTEAALWGVLAQPTLAAGSTINHGAILRTFSGLPLHLRKQLGPRLSDMFIRNGSPDAAREIRDAILRAAGDHGTAVSMIDARLELATGDARAAEHLLETVVAEDGPVSPEAIVLAIQSRLDRGAAVDPAMIETVGALAFEHRLAEDGPDLARAHILALASGLQFDEAFASYRRWRGDGPMRLQPETLAELFSILALPESKPLFLQTYFSNRDLVGPRETARELRVALAEELLGTGFTDEARRLVGPEASTSESGRLFLARAAMADFDPASALRHLAGMQGQGAMKIRGEALSQMGRHDEAIAAFVEAEAQSEAGSEAWRAGDWAQVATLGSDPHREAVSGLGLASAEPATQPISEPDVAAGGPLAMDQALLEESRAARAALEALLLSTPTVPAVGG